MYQGSRVGGCRLDWSGSGWACFAWQYSSGSIKYEKFLMKWANQEGIKSMEFDYGVINR
jgi:hypothetical protein